MSEKGRRIAIIIGLLFVDQFIKLFIWRFCYDTQGNIIGKWVRFRPVQNTNLSWGGNYFALLSNFWVVVILNALIILLFISIYAYYCTKRTSPSKVVNGIYCAGLASAVCSFIDKVFWGGSIDYIQITGLFTFDLKDCYITVAEILFIIVVLKHHSEISTVDYLQWCFRRKKQK